MQHETIHFNNSILSVKFIVYELLWPILSIALIDLAGELILGLLVHHSGAELEAFALSHWFKHLSYLIIATFAIVCIYQAPTYLNKYVVHDGHLFIKEYMYFIPILEVTIPIADINKVEIKKKRFALNSQQLIITIEDKEYTLHVKNGIDQFHDFLQSQIKNS